MKEVEILCEGRKIDERSSKYSESKTGIVELGKSWQSQPHETDETQDEGPEREANG